MQKPAELQVSLENYTEEEWELLWESLLVNCSFPPNTTAIPNRVAYAYNYANSMVEFLKQQVEEGSNDGN